MPYGMQHNCFLHCCTNNVYGQSVPCLERIHFTCSIDSVLAIDYNVLVAILHFTDTLYSFRFYCSVIDIKTVDMFAIF